MFFSIHYITNAHKEPTHQYIIREGYALLKKHLGQSIPEFERHILGLDSSGTEGEFHTSLEFPWQYSTIAGGVWSEDIYDPVRHMHEMPISTLDGVFTSITHFWDPDNEFNGYNNNFTLHLPWNPWPTGILEINFCSLARTYLPNYHYDLMAYRKAMIYLSSQEYKPTLTEYYTFTFDGIEYPSPGFYGYSLIDWYHDKMKYDNPALELAKNNIIYSVIGRIAHLLGDMSIPAHVKCDEHGIWHDPYEDAMNYKEWDGNKESPCINMYANIPSAKQRVEYWNAQKVLAEKGSFIRKECSIYPENPLWGLFYSTAQIADHFASNRFDGDDVYYNIGEIYDILHEQKNEKFKGPTTTLFIDGNPSLSGYARKEHDLLAIRDVTFPYIIRATAGLLYYFAQEFNLINESGVCPNNVFLEDIYLQGKHYYFAASDSIVAGNEKRPFTIGNTVQSTLLQAGTCINIRKGFHAVSGSNVHMIIDECKECEQEFQSTVQENIISESIIHDKASTDYTVISDFISPSNNRKSSCGSSCCDDTGISNISICNIMNQEVMMIHDTKGSLSDIETDNTILTNKPGIYSVHITYSDGSKKHSVISRMY